VLAPPPGLTEEALATALRRHWDLAGPLAYQPVGWGSHHYRLGDRWFVTVDELELKRRTRGELLDAAFDRLRRALAAARGLADQGHDFAVAPVSTQDGEPVARLGDRFAVALYPFVAGESFGWGEFSSVDHRRATLALVVAVHSSGTPSVAAVDDFVVPHRDELEAALSGEPVPDCGPFAQPEMLDLYRTRWKVNDLAIDTERFRRPHGDGADERQSWQLLRSQVASLQ
jgi:hypothetical protein